VKDLTRRQAPIPHGTNHAYSNLGCRCDACREAQRLYKADLRRRHRYGGYIERRKRSDG
jgi:hypothetical protein